MALILGTETLAEIGGENISGSHHCHVTMSDTAMQAFGTSLCNVNERAALLEPRSLSPRNFIVSNYVYQV